MTPKVVQRLVNEIRHAFSSSSDINARECAELDYLMAVIKESLRVYPPVATSLPRISPPEGIVVDGHFFPPGIRSSFFSRILVHLLILPFAQVTISTHHYASYRSPANFARPEEFHPER